MNIESKRTLIGEVEKLLDHELYESAETLCTFYASHLTAVEFKPAPAGESISLVLAEIYELLADALHRGKQFKRALHNYRTANHRRKSAQQPKFRSQTTTFSSEEAILKFKECKCLVALRDLSSALKGLEGIPAKFRTAPVHLLLANLYKRGNRRPNAIAAYKEALALLPHAIEIIQHLVDLGVEASEILATVDDALRYKESASLISDGWLHSLVTAMVLKRNHEFEKSMSHLQRLTATFPKNSYLLTHQVQVATEMDLLDQAMAFYRQVRKLDTHILHGAAEVFGRLLYLREDAAELSKLTDDVLDACPHVPAGWLLAAMFSAVKGESESALAFIDKAVRLEPTCGEAYRLRGQVLFEQESVDQAVIAFAQASSIDKDLHSFAGQVRCHLGLGKSKEAAACAREALSLYPRSCEAHIVMGSVFTAGSAESMNAYAKALQLSPLSRQAAAALAEALLAQGKAEEAVACLQSILSKVSCHKLRLTLGKVYAELGRYKESVENLHQAISLNPANSNSNSRDAALGTENEAEQELERVEGLMRGENEEEEEVEVEVDEGEEVGYGDEQFEYYETGEHDGDGDDDGDCDDDGVHAMEEPEGDHELHELQTMEEIQAVMRGHHQHHHQQQRQYGHSGRSAPPQYGDSPYSPHSDHSGGHMGGGSLNHSLLDAFNQHFASSGDQSPPAGANSRDRGGRGLRRSMFADSVGSEGGDLFRQRPRQQQQEDHHLHHSGGVGAESSSRDQSLFEEGSDVLDDALMYGSLNNSDEAPFTP